MDENVENMLRWLIETNTSNYKCHRCGKTWKGLKTRNKPSVCKYCNSSLWDKPLKKNAFKPN